MDIYLDILGFIWISRRWLATDLDSGMTSSKPCKPGFRDKEMKLTLKSEAHWTLATPGSATNLSCCSAPCRTNITAAVRIRRDRVIIIRHSLLRPTSINRSTIHWSLLHALLLSETRNANICKKIFAFEVRELFDWWVKIATSYKVSHLGFVKVLTKRLYTLIQSLERRHLLL